MQLLMAAQDWESASGIARAFSIGPKESKAVRELVVGVPDLIRNRLEAAVKVRGMSLFLNHDTIGNGTFSVGFSSASGACEAWHEELTNLKESHDLVARHPMVFAFSLLLFEDRRLCSFLLVSGARFRFFWTESSTTTIKQRRA